jgi:lactate dehydrogenase-like 2-hydroxyacid dehydrogenase
MLMTRVLAIGSYNDSERPALERDFAPRLLNSPDEIDSLPDSDRGGVEVVAYKSGDAFGAAEMALLPALGLIANYGVGYDAIDVAAAEGRGVRVSNTPDVLNDDVADLAVAMWLMQGRRMRQGDTHVREGRWAAGERFPLNRKLSGGVVGIMGLGRIGHAIADRLTGFGCEVHYHSRSEKETPGWTYHADPVALAQAVDFLFVALVGGPETENYVSAEVIAALGARGVLINISRGSTVDEDALLDALESGALAGAGLDVFRDEPQIDPRFLALDNVVLQPHQASGTVETRAAMAALQRANVAAFLAGEALPSAVV